MQIRELTRGDIQSLAEFCSANLRYDKFEANWLDRMIFKDPGYVPHLTLSAQEGGRIVGAMVGVTRKVGKDILGWLKLFAVDESRRRRGIASELLRRVEDGFREMGVAKVNVLNCAPAYYIWPGIDLRYTEGICFLLERGYRRYGDAVNMTVDLAGRDFSTEALEDKLKNEGIEVRRLEERDRPAFDAMLRAEWSENWYYEAMTSFENEPISTFIALREGKILGFASYDTNMFPGTFGPMGTSQELRGKGIGSALFLRCMRDMRDKGYKRAEIGWVGPIVFYSKAANAKISRAFWFMTKDI
ncbi:MAG: GNAT family N-acetyltransferase [bacterium]